MTHNRLVRVFSIRATRWWRSLQAPTLDGSGWFFWCLGCYGSYGAWLLVMSWVHPAWLSTYAGLGFLLVIAASLGKNQTLEDRRKLAQERERLLNAPGYLDDLLESDLIQHARRCVPHYDTRVEAIKEDVLRVCKEHLERRRGPHKDTEHWDGTVSTRMLPKGRVRVVFSAPFGPHHQIKRFQRTITDVRILDTLRAQAQGLSSKQRSLMHLALHDHVWRDAQPLSAHQRLELRKRATSCA